MAFLGTTELANIRTHMEATLSSTCTIEYLTEAADGMGGQTRTWTSRGSAIPCRLSAFQSTGGMLGAVSGIAGEQVREGFYWHLALHHDQAVAESDRVTVGGVVYQVQQETTGESDLALKRVRLILWQ